MPGIVGMIAKGSFPEKTKVLDRMMKCMMHESFYTSGTYVNKQLGICLGWVNISGSFTDCMPVWNEKKDICLVFNGENFVDRGLAEKLKAKGHDFEPSNAGYLVHLYEENEGEFIQSLNGWFSGVLIDLRKKEVVLFNDRFGMQRIYYHAGKDVFYFSSEAKSILKVCPETKELEMKGLSEVISFGCVLENRTLFSEIFLLPPGSNWIFKNGALKREEQYFAPDVWEKQPLLGKEDFYKHLRATFLKLLPRYFDTEQKIALSLTGGLDTRMIMASKDLAPNELPCYTFGGMYRDCFDVKVARKVAMVCKQSHRVLTVDKHFFSDFPELAEKTVYVTDGNLDVSGSADLYVNKMAREIAPIRLTGNYGSEVLRGSVHLKAMPACKGLFNGAFEDQINAAANTLSDVRRGNRVTFAAFKQTPWHHYNRLALEQSQLCLRSPYLDNDLVKLMFRAPDEVLNSGELSFRLINDGNIELGNMMTDRGLGGNKSHWVSRMAYLYHEFLFKADYAYNYGMPQWLAKIDHTVLSPLHMERLFLGQHKFYHFRRWFRDELADYVREILLDQRSLNRPYLRGRFVEKMVSDHTAGRLNYTTEITKLLTFELLQRQMID